MRIEGEQDFSLLRKHIQAWRSRFPMFVHDVNRIEHIIENHIQNFAIAGVHYRQTKQKRYLENAQNEINEINRVLELVEKLELMALLSR